MSQLHPIQPPAMSRVDNSKATPSFIYFTIATSKLTLLIFLAAFISLNHAAPEPESIPQEKQAVSVDVKK